MSTYVCYQIYKCIKTKHANLLILLTKQYLHSATKSATVTQKMMELQNNEHNKLDVVCFPSQSFVVIYRLLFIRSMSTENTICYKISGIHWTLSTIKFD